MTSTLTQYPEASQFQADPEVRRAATHGPNSVDECFFCGRGLTERALQNGWWVHLNVGGYLVPQDYGSENEDEARLSQGCFPVGSECAKKIARPFKFKMAAA
jgi:hypothetical protein